METPTSPQDPFDITLRERLAVLAPIYGTIVVALIVGLWSVPGPTKELVALIPTAFVAAGKFLPLWGISGKSNFGPYELAVVIWLLDTFTVVNVVYALEAFYKIRPLKRSIDRFQSNAKLVLVAYPSLRRATTVGIVLFVLFPVSGTGALVGTFLGILLGLHRAVLIAAVSVGGIVGGMIMAFAASNFAGAVKNMEILRRDPTIRYASIAMVLVICGVLVWVGNRAFKRALARAAENDDTDSEPIGAGTPRGVS